MLVAELQVVEAEKLEQGGVKIGDVDGVCIVPSLAADEVFNKALEKVRGENQVRNALRAGMSARQAFHSYGIM